MGGSMGSEGEARVSDQFNNDYVDTRQDDYQNQQLPEDVEHVQNISDIYSEPKIMSGKSENN